ncbi:hypothetical protein ABES80_03245 [Bacillus gobiensis]|uniref:hypothetical protein n=1 Tax=Bacillus gobiensis TaxID=1441095 RepID=UPI003D20A93A
MNRFIGDLWEKSGALLHDFSESSFSGDLSDIPATVMIFRQFFDISAIFLIFWRSFSYSGDPSLIPAIFLLFWRPHSSLGSSINENAPNYCILIFLIVPKIHEK